MTQQESFSKIIHEVKNSITFINSSLQIMVKKHPEVENFDYWSDIVQEVTFLKNTMIELSSARLNDQLTLMPVEPVSFISDVLSICHPVFEPTHFTCNLHSDISLPMMNADANRLKRAFINLLKNSFEAMNQIGSMEIIISVQNSYIHFDLIDFGGGFSPEYLPKLFTPFETTKPDGTGLGLLIAKQIIELHGGHLHVDSRPENGCTFSILLPTAQTP